MPCIRRLLAVVVIAEFAGLPSAATAGDNDLRAVPAPPPIARDSAVRYDYDIVYVRAPRHGDERRTAWADFSDPTRMEPGADLVLLRPDGTEEVLVEGDDGSVLDPYVSFDGRSVYYAKFIDAAHTGSDVYRLDVASRKITKLTDQTFTPNTGAAPWSADFRTPEKGKSSLRYGVYSLGPCPLPGGRLVFTSNRNAHVPPRGYPKITLQLFAMDDDGRNVEQIGHLNIGCALHPVVLTDGRIIFSSLESQGLHNGILWAIWSIRPDGTVWEPMVSAFATGGAPPGFHFQTQLSDGAVVVEQYYNLNNSGFGTYLKLPPKPPPNATAFGPGDLRDPRNARQPYGGRQFQMPFQTAGMEVLTRFAFGADGPSQTRVPKEQVKPRRDDGFEYPHALGKVTHPCGAPDNHLLTAWTAGPANHQYGYYPLIDSGIYLLRDGLAIDGPDEMLLVKNDPRYNEQWPRPLVSYKRIYGIDEPARLATARNEKYAAHLPEGTPYGLVGTSSLYKRESAPGGVVAEGSVTAVSPDKRLPLNWQLQGSDAGVYGNDAIHAIRIVAQEPRTDITGNKGPPRYGSHANERLRILGEIPVRKFTPLAPYSGRGAGGEGAEPRDPDGNPDTSFLAKIPADQAFTFQMLDRDGMVLTTAQTWHQVRPGEVRYDCGGCHAHSQRPTDFESTAAAAKDYAIFDLTERTPLVTSKKLDESGRRWDADDATGLRYVEGLANVEFYRDIKPILARSCTACHTAESDKAPGGLVLDDYDQSHSQKLANGDATSTVSGLPGPYYHLAAELHNTVKASRYVTKLQARRSLLVWKIYGRRTDGFSNDDFASFTDRDDPRSLRLAGEKVPRLDYNDLGALERHLRDSGDLDYTGSVMPPPAAVAAGKVQPLSDEDRRTIVRWIDLGCPIDLDPDYDPQSPNPRSYGWMGDDQRPTLVVSTPAVGRNAKLDRIRIGLADAYTGLDLKSLTVAADFTIDGTRPGENLADKFDRVAPGVWEYRLKEPLDSLKPARLDVSIKDRQGNVTRVERSFSIDATTQ